MNALWWWIDRWRKSSAFMDMTLEQQGAYRNLLDEATLRGGPLPNDERVLAKACGDAKAWRRVKPVVMARFELKSDGWHNQTLDEVYQRSVELSEQRSIAGAAGNRKRWGKHRKPVANASQKVSQTPSQTPSQNGRILSPISVSVLTVPKEQEPLAAAVTARSKRPIFQGRRFSVFEWMLDDLMKLLGNYTEEFDLHQWFFDLDERARREDIVIPQRDGGAWLQAETLKEAQRRGLAIAVASAPPTAGKLTTRMAAMIAQARNEP